jgi:YesN/AraC family two-component response regulator
MNIKKGKKICECGCIGEGFDFYENDIRILELVLFTHHPQCNKNHFLPLHKEKNINILFANSSPEIYQVENKEIIIPKGMYTIINSNQIFAGKDKKKIVVPKQDLELIIHPSIFENVLEELNLKKPNCGLEFDVNPQKKSQLLENVIKILISSYKDSEGFGSSLLVEQSLLQLATVLLKEHPNSVKEIMKKEPQILKRDPRIQNALDYIRDNYNKKISLDELSKESMIGKWRLIQLFKQELGQSPFSYLNEYRVKKAIELLKNNPFLSLEEIAEKTGFASASYMWRMFIKYVGSSPSSFKPAK